MHSPCENKKNPTDDMNKTVNENLNHFHLFAAEVSGQHQNKI